MKKILFILGLVFVLLGCTTTEQLIYSELYTDKTEYHEDIRGNYTAHTMSLFKDIQFAATDILEIQKSEHENGTITGAFVLHYFGSGWRFYESLMIKTDSGLYTLEDKDPYRKVRSGDSVIEMLYLPISKEMLVELMSTKSMTIQYYAEPHQLPVEGITRMQEFLVGN